MQVGIDGINVDFEKISKDCGVHYIQFIRELSVKCRQNGIVLSVDNYVPKGYNQQYNRKEQGVMADYVIIMGYDERYTANISYSCIIFTNEPIEVVAEVCSKMPTDMLYREDEIITVVIKIDCLRYYGCSVDCDYDDVPFKIYRWQFQTVGFKWS